MKRIGIGASLGAVVLALAACGSSDSGGSSADYPSRDIRMVISYAAGGPTDIAGRGIAKYLSEKFGVSVPVENLDGASGSAGTLEVVNAKADGYTIGVTTASAVSRVPLIQDVGYTMDDVVPIGVVTDLPGIIFVPTDSPYETIEDLFEAAKANPNKVTVGAAGAQTPQAVELERLKTEYDVPLQVVPFQGDGPAVTALIGGQVDAAIPTYSSATKAQYDSGAIRALAVVGTEVPDYVKEDVPTLAEVGYDKIVYGSSTFMLIAPKGTPAEVIATLEDAVAEAEKDPDTVEVIGAGIPAEFVGSEALAKQMKEEVDVIGPIVKELFATN